MSQKLGGTGKTWKGSFVIVHAGEGLSAKPVGTAQFTLAGTKARATNALARRIAKGCR